MHIPTIIPIASTTISAINMIDHAHSSALTIRDSFLPTTIASEFFIVFSLWMIVSLLIVRDHLLTLQVYSLSFFRYIVICDNQCDK